MATSHKIHDTQKTFASHETCDCGPHIRKKGGEGILDVPIFLRLKGIIKSDDGGNTWFVSRIDYLTGADSEYSRKQFLDVPKEWQPCLLVLKRETEDGYDREEG